LRRQIIHWRHRRIGGYDFPLRHKGNALKKIAFADLAGASESAQLEDHLAGTAAESFGLDLVALLPGGLHYSIEDRLRRVKAGLGSLCQYQTQLSGGGGLAFGHENLDHTARTALLAHRLPGVPSDSRR